jgi:hypothetical protein
MHLQVNKSFANEGYGAPNKTAHTCRQGVDFRFTDPVYFVKRNPIDKILAIRLANGKYF